jgi:hypothetical protein
VAALLAAVSPIDVFYSQEIRMYPLLPALGGISLLATLNVLDRGKRRDWVTWVVVAALCLYVYYYFGLLVAAEALALVLVWRRGQVLPWVMAQGVVALTLVPWLAVMAARLGHTNLALPPETEVHLTPAGYLALNGIDFTLGFTRPPHADILLAFWAIAVLAGIGILGRRSQRTLALVALALAVPVLGAYAVLLARPFFYPRFILFAIVPLWSLVANGLAGSRRAWPLGMLALIALCVGSFWTWRIERVTPRSGYAPDDYRTVFASIAPEIRPGDVIVGGYPWQSGYVDAYLGGFGASSAYVPGPLDASRLAELAGPKGRVWLYTYAPDGKFTSGELDRLRASDERIAFLDQFGDTRAALFVRNPPTAAPREAALATFEHEIALTSATVAPEGVPPGAPLQVELRWRALTPPSGGYTVFVHVLGPDGNVLAQRDAPPLGGEAPTDHWSEGEVVVDRYALAVPASAPAGRYQIEVGLYRPENGRRLVVSPAQPDNRVIVSEVNVAR